MSEAAAVKNEEQSTAAGLSMRRFGPILAIQFLGTLGFSMAIPFLVFIVTDLGGAAWTYGLVGAIYSAFQLIGAPLLGRWSDRAGRRRVLVASQTGTLAAWLLFLLALSLPLVELFEFAGATLTIPLLLVCVARALDGATGGNVSVANAYVADLTRDHPEIRQKAFGRMGIAASLGFVIGPASAGLLAGTALGVRLPIGVAAAFAALTTAAIIVLLKEPRHRCPQGPPPPDNVEAVLHQQAKPSHRRHERRALLRGLAHGPATPVLVGTFLIFLAFNFFYAAFPVHAMAKFGWSTTDLGAFFAVLATMMVFAQGPLLSFVSDKLPPRAVFAIGTCCLAGAMVAYALPGGVITYAGGALFAVGNGLAWPTFQSRVAAIGGDMQGVVQGAVTSMSSFAGIVGLLVAGMLYPLLGGIVFFAAAAVFVVVALLTSLWFSTRVAQDI